MTARTPSGPLAPLQPRFRIFLAEDDVEFRGLLASVLRHDGYEVVEASEGATLLFNLGRDGVGQQYQGRDTLVICDVRMPMCDGLAILRNLREHEARCPKFVFMTAFPDRDILDEAERLGAITVLEKPFELAELRAVIGNFATEVAHRHENDDATPARVAGASRG